MQLNLDPGCGRGLDLDLGRGLDLDLGRGLNVDLGIGLDLDLGLSLDLDLDLGIGTTDLFDLAPFHPNVRKLPWQWGSWGCGDTLRG